MSWSEIVERWGRLDVVVHNAIYMPLVTFEATTPEEWSRQIDVGLGGMFNCTHAAWPRMKAQGGGHIIGIASGSSVRGYQEEIAYCTIKHGVEGFVKALSLEAREHNIALNTIGPGARIKPTRVTWAEHDQAPAELRATWTDPVRLGRAWVWLAAQPPARYSGYRFDAAHLVETIAREGEDFEFAPEKVTRYPDDFRARQDWYEPLHGLESSQESRALTTRTPAVSRQLVPRVRTIRGRFAVAGRMGGSGVHRGRNLALTAVFFLGSMALWEGAVRGLEVPPFVLPAPSAVAVALWRGLASGLYLRAPLVHAASRRCSGSSSARPSASGSAPRWP